VTPIPTEPPVVEVTWYEEVTDCHVALAGSVLAVQVIPSVDEAAAAE
jgi:hypothetical protein